MSLPFDGESEIRQRLERGQSYGLTKDQYGALAHVSMGALRMAGVEPAEIRQLAGGQEAGADVVLYGAHWVYTLRMTPAEGRSVLYGQQLDSKLGGPGVTLCTHEFAGNDYVGDILSVILHYEGVPLIDAEEAAEYTAEQMRLNPPKPPRPIWE